MQKIALLLMVIFARQSIAMDGGEAFLKALTRQEEISRQLSTNTAAKKPKLFDPEDLTPPDCFREQQLPAAVLQTEPLKVGTFETASVFDGNIDWSFLQGLDEEDDNFLDISYLPSAPLPPPIYHLVAFDHNIQQMRTFAADSKSDLLKSFLIAYIYQANTEVWRAARNHLHAKVPHLPICLQENNAYSIKCNAGAGLCNHLEVAQSQELVVVQLFAHFVVTHCTNSLWYKEVSAYIGDSYEEALQKAQRLN